LQAQSTINSENLRKHIETLASDEYEGRLPGTKGGDLAAEYIKQQFEKIGLEAINGSYFQSLEVVTKISLTDNNSLNFNGIEQLVNKDFIPFAFSAYSSFKGSVVFAGYGFDINENDFKWNDYANIDVKDKWVVVLLGDPENENPKSPFLKYSEPRSKVITAQDKGAKGVLFIQGTKVSRKDELLALYYDKSDAKAGIPVVNITRALANKILSPKGTTIEDLEKNIDSLKVQNSFALEGEVSAKVELNFEKVPTQNVIGMLKGFGNENDYLVIGAHYDHLGWGGPGSGSRKPEENAVHNGADDNASGVAGVIELARILKDINKSQMILSDSRKLLQKNIIFIAFTAEELGVLGSRFFVNSKIVDNKKIKAMINMDMIGRLKEDNTLIVGGTGTAKETDTLLDALSEKHSIKLSKSSEGLGPSDHAPFYAEDIPVFFFSTGAHEDYHKPSDDFDKINYPGMEKSLSLIFELAHEIAWNKTELTFQESGPKTRTGTGRYKVKLGFMPDFASTDKPGVAVAGVTKGSPAEQGGLLKNDRILAIDGKSTKDIYEYMARLNTLEPGKQITIDVNRDGVQIVLIIQL
jgi:Zn-dependent M28 family amino/carboxypeptidase